MKKLFALCLTLIFCGSLIAGCGSTAVPTTTASLSAVASGNWKAMDSSAAQGTNLTAVWGSSPSDIFAVGADGMILHYDGQAWSTMTSGTFKHLSGIWGSSPSDVFAVGEDGTILHYDGKSWTTMDSSNTNWLYGIWGTSSKDVFVGGPKSNLHYDGTTWNSSLSVTDWPNSLWGSSSSDVFAVCLGGVILHYDGTTWSSMLTAMLPVTTTKTTADKTTTPTTFTTVNNPFLLYDFYGVWGSSPSDVFAVGGAHYTGKAIILHYDGKIWTTVNVGGADELYGLWGSSTSNIFAVGFTGTVLHFDGKVWSRMTSGTTYDLHGVWGSSPSDVFAVGNGGTILRYYP
jgi:hypothetical protein